jgi:hypothetical protein
MTSHEHQELHNRSIVVAITHDNARLWLLNEDTVRPNIVVERREPENVHVRSAQANHGHASEIGEVGYFAEIVNEIRDASSILLLGHGTGKANAAERFVHYLRNHEKLISMKVASIETLNLPALSDGEIVNEAHRRWKVLTMRS